MNSLTPETPETEPVATSEDPGQRGAAGLEAVAAAIFARFGVDFSTVQRAGGWTNAVWLAERVVLRLSTGPGNENLAREARLAALFGPAVGYPAMIATGKTEGLSWSLAAAWREPGVGVGRAGLGGADEGADGVVGASGGCAQRRASRGGGHCTGAGVVQ